MHNNIFYDTYKNKIILQQYIKNINFIFSKQTAILFLNKIIYEQNLNTKNILLEHKLLKNKNIFFQKYILNISNIAENQYDIFSYEKILNEDFSLSNLCDKIKINAEKIKQKSEEAWNTCKNISAEKLNKIQKYSEKIYNFGKQVTQFIKISYIIAGKTALGIDGYNSIQQIHKDSSNLLQYLNKFSFLKILLQKGSDNISTMNKKDWINLSKAIKNNNNLNKSLNQIANNAAKLFKQNLLNGKEQIKKEIKKLSNNLLSEQIYTKIFQELKNNIIDESQNIIINSIVSNKKLILQKIKNIINCYEINLISCEKIISENTISKILIKAKNAGLIPVLLWLAVFVLLFSLIQGCHTLINTYITISTGGAGAGIYLTQLAGTPFYVTACTYLSGLLTGICLPNLSCMFTETLQNAIELTITGSNAGQTKQEIKERNIRKKQSIQEMLQEGEKEIQNLK